MLFRVCIQLELLRTTTNSSIGSNLMWINLQMLQVVTVWAEMLLPGIHFDESSRSVACFILYSDIIESILQFQLLAVIADNSGK